MKQIKTNLIKLVLQQLVNKSSTAVEIEEKFNTLKPLFNFDVEILELFLDNDAFTATIMIEHNKTFFRTISINL
ncbi:MAG: hypothetical protein RLZZ546_976 [Bacteroidota bacterium]|jgi:hypothetical protein